MQLHQFEIVIPHWNTSVDAAVFSSIAQWFLLSSDTSIQIKNYSISTKHNIHKLWWYAQEIISYINISLGISATSLLLPLFKQVRVRSWLIRPSSFYITRPTSNNSFLRHLRLNHKLLAVSKTLEVSSRPQQVCGHDIPSNHPPSKLALPLRNNLHQLIGPLTCLFGNETRNFTWHLWTVQLSWRRAVEQHGVQRLALE